MILLTVSYYREEKSVSKTLLVSRDNFFLVKCDVKKTTNRSNEFLDIRPRSLATKLETKSLE